MGGELIREGNIYWSNWNGRKYPFRLRGISRTGVCDWEPVFSARQADSAKIMGF